MHKIIISLIAFSFCFASQANAEQFDDLRSVYKTKWTELVSSIEQRTELSFIQKMAVYEREVSGLKKQYAEDKSNAYKGREETITVNHECKGRPGGSTKSCGVRCVQRPNEDMYTTEDWVTFNGDTMKETVSEEKACFKLEAKGNTLKEGSVTAVFKHRSSYIDYKTLDDADALFRSFSE